MLGAVLTGDSGSGDAINFSRDITVVVDVVSAADDINDVDGACFSDGAVWPGTLVSWTVTGDI